MVSRLETSPTFMLGQECLDVSWRLNHPNSLSMDWWCFRDGLWIVTGSPYFSHGKKKRETSCRCSHQSIDPKHRRGHRISPPWCAAAPVNARVWSVENLRFFYGNRTTMAMRIDGDTMGMSWFLPYFYDILWLGSENVGLSLPFFIASWGKWLLNTKLGMG